MNFKEELIKQIERGSKKIKIIGLLNPKTQLNLSIASLNGKIISLDTPINEIKIRFQPQYKEDGVWTNMIYKLDNCHKNQPPHTHWLDDTRFPTDNILNLRDAFISILGTDFWEGKGNKRAKA